MATYSKIENLSRGKKEKYEELRKQALDSQMAFAEFYYNIERLEVKLEPGSKLANAVKFITEELLELYDWGYEDVSTIIKFSNKNKNTVDYRDIKLLHSIITKVKGRGVEFAKKFYAAMEGIAESVALVYEMDKNQSILAKNANDAANAYTKFCRDNHLMPEDFESIVDKKMAELGLIPSTEPEKPQDKEKHAAKTGKKTEA